MSKKDRDIQKDWDIQTNLIRGGVIRSNLDENSEALFLTSSFVYDSAEQAKDAFERKVPHYIYSRYENPTVDMFQERLRLLDGADACLATSSGMGAISTAILSLLSPGDHVVSSRALFGSCSYILDTILPNYGVQVTFVDGTNLEEWKQALSKKTKLVFFETPSNPQLDLVDIEAVSSYAKAIGALVLVDNIFASPALQSPREFGADFVLYSGTKHIDGQGRTMSGAILGPQPYMDEQVQPWFRHTGPCLSPFNAWVLLKGLETLDLRVQRQCDNAEALLAVLKAHPRVGKIYYPFDPEHPQYDLAKKQMKRGGTVLSFTLLDRSGQPSEEAAFSFMNALGTVSISNNFGDSRSLITHPSTTTHQRLTEEQRQAVNITPGLVRFSAGLESENDLIKDFERALSNL